MKNIVYVSFISSVFFLLFCHSVFAENKVPASFDSGEHIGMGNTARLFDPIQGKIVTGGEIDFRQWGLMPSLQTPLTFGRIVAVPDLFADLTPISDGKTLTERRELFNRSFEVFLRASPKNVDAVFSIMQEETDMIKEALARGILPSQAYAQKGYYFVEKYFLAYPAAAKILLVGWDHFTQYAHLAYEAGHAEALSEALLAHLAKDPDQKNKWLALAYAKEAYACHFLTDSFAAGHLRTPDKELATAMSQRAVPQAVAAVIALLMHDEDNHYGVHVVNVDGNAWTAYGDTRYYDKLNAQNKLYAEQAVQVSVDEVTLAFFNGEVKQPKQYAAKRLLPVLSILQDYLHYVDSQEKTIPMFALRSGTDEVLRRRDINELHPVLLPLSSRSMKPHGGEEGWWGWTTLLELKVKYHPELTGKDGMSGDGLVTASPDGQLTPDDLHLLARYLSPLEKAIFCADSTTDRVFKNYLQC